MAEMQTLVVAQRDATTNKALRRAGSVPAVVYGRETEAQSVQVSIRTLETFLRVTGSSSMFTLKIEDQEDEHMVLIRELQRDPVTDHIVHLDFYAVVAGEAISNSVPVILLGTSAATELGATVSISLDEIELEALPKDMPSRIEVDITPLEEPGQSISVGDLVLPDGVTALSPSDMIVVQAVVQRAMEEEEEVEEIEGEEGEIEGEEGEIEGEEGAEAPAEEEAAD